VDVVAALPFRRQIIWLGEEGREPEMEFFHQIALRGEQGRLRCCAFHGPAHAVAVSHEHHRSVVEIP
jgi:hypothetical protein